MIRRFLTLPDNIKTVLSFFLITHASAYMAWVLSGYWRHKILRMYLMSNLMSVLSLKDSLGIIEFVFFLFLSVAVYLFILFRKETVRNDKIKELVTDYRHTSDMMTLIDEYEGKIRAWENEVYGKRRIMIQVIDAIPDIFVFAKDYDGNFFIVNRTVAECYGCHPKEIIGKKDSDFTNDWQKFLTDDRRIMDRRIPELGIKETVNCNDCVLELITDKYPIETWDCKPAVLGISRITGRTVIKHD